MDMETTQREVLIDHWLLNMGVEHPVSLRLILPSIEDEALNVKPIPHCDSKDYSDGLTRLFEEGKIEITPELSGNQAAKMAGLSNILQRLLALPREQRAVKPLRRGSPLSSSPTNAAIERVQFQLTAIGGEAWERIARPDWTRVLTESRDTTSGELFSPNADLLMAYIGWYPELHGEEVKLGTVTWQTHSNFRILYWKALPLVQHASFTLQPSGHRWPATEPKWFQNWWISACSWHKKPWELLEWPKE
jgi:hypothetical protein